MGLPKKIAGLPLLLIIVVTAGCGGFGSHRVQQGDTLYSISWRYGLDYREVAAWNNLKPPYTIFDGQMLHIAPPDGRTGQAVAIARPMRAPPAAGAATVSAPRAPAITSQSSVPIRWQWPVRGALLQAFSAADSARKGIDISGRVGQPISAAAAGQVVYAGSGLLNYGKLIILKHDDNYLSAYAYNRTLHVKEGEVVAGGQHIADMGSKAGGDTMLHFEIRYDGQPMNPLKYLPPLRQ